MITFSFYKVSEKKPKNGEEIILLRKQDSFGFESFESKTVKVWYDYQEIDENGEWTGNSWFEPQENCIEVLYVGSTPLGDDEYWCPLNEYWESIYNDKEI